MKRQKKNNSGITLVALVVSIIVMLVLAGVSLNATIGENGIVTQAQNATLMQRIATYLEEFQMYKVNEWIKQGIDDELYFYASGNEMKTIIPSMADEDLPDFCVLSGNLTYLGTNEKYIEAMSKLEGYYIASSSELTSTFAERVKGYVEELEETKRTDATKRAYLLSKDSVSGSYISNYIPSMNSSDRELFEIQYGTLVYVDVTNPDNQLALSTAGWTKGYLGLGSLAIDGYVAPVDVTKKSTGTTDDGIDWTVYNDAIKSSDWKTIENSDGTLTIIEYTGPGGTIVIPDELVINGVTKNVTKIDGQGKNIFFSSNDLATRTMLTTSKVKKVAVADDIGSIVNYGLSNCGENVQVHILYDKDANLDLGNGPGRGPGNGIVGSCGSLTFVYKLQLWGASGASGSPTFNNSKDSQCGLGGYSEGCISLNSGEKLFVYIGGRGLVGTTDEDNPSGGYNGGGAGLYRNNNTGYGGGGSTDIRYGGSIVTQEGDDYRILVAGGGGGSDNYGNYAPNSGDDGRGGSGGGTVNEQKTSWSGIDGYVDGRLNNVMKYIGTINDAWCYKKSYVSTDGEKYIIVNATAGGWDSENNSLPKGNIYREGTSTITKLYGGGAGRERGAYSYASPSSYTDLGGGGGGYYGGEASAHNNGGGAGGSAYADISKVTNIIGYCGQELRTDDTPSKGNYGNGEVKITKI